MDVSFELWLAEDARTMNMYLCVWFDKNKPRTNKFVNPRIYFQVSLKNMGNIYSYLVHLCAFILSKYCISWLSTPFYLLSRYVYFAALKYLFVFPSTMPVISYVSAICLSF